MFRSKSILSVVPRTCVQSQSKAREENQTPLCTCNEWIAKPRPTRHLTYNPSQLSRRNYKALSRPRLPSSRPLLVESSNVRGLTSHVALARKLKRYGIVFVVVDTCTWLATTSTFFVLFSMGVQMDTLLFYAEQVSDVQYWAGIFNIETAELAGDKAALSLSLMASTVTFPIRIYLDFLVLFLLRKLGLIYVPNETPPQD